jgi:hypothetical protein
MKDRFFKDPLVSFTGENTIPCEYTGSSDLYPKRNRNLINDEHSAEAAIKIQRFWRGFRAPATEPQKRKQNKVNNWLHITLNEPRKDRFWSWFPF